MIKCISGLFLTLTIVSVSSISDDICERCVPAQDCQVLRDMNYREQRMLLENFQCRPSYSVASVFGATDDVFVCCTNNILDFLNNPNVRNKDYTRRPGSQKNPAQGKAFHGQCAGLTTFPPAPDSECCGREASDDDRVGSSQKTIEHLLTELNKGRSLRTGRVPRHLRKRSSDDNNEDDKDSVILGDRIAGGSETEFYQFPWTVLLTMTFDTGNNQISRYNCGGSLLSARYVLTAAHCVSHEGATLKSIKVTLAEYDKRTFPIDCKISMGKRKCIENIQMEAERFIFHSEYNDKSLANDIALLKLRGNAPYTEYIRPICLPPFNINQQDLSDLQLAVAGWGKNGTLTSDLKQFTVVNLVPHRECGRFYTQLNTRQLCAVGYAGEDTCSGDSGGPLMTLYRGKYYVVGIVSGKRADSPCGTSVPSLFTDVYPYLDWIKNNIKN